jgi:hypothetical protein
LLPELGQHLLQPPVPLLNGLRLDDHRRIHAALLRPPCREGRVGLAVRPAQLGHRHAAFSMTQERESAAQCICLSSFRIPSCSLPRKFDLCGSDLSGGHRMTSISQQLSRRRSFTRNPRHGRGDVFHGACADGKPACAEHRAAMDMVHRQSPGSTLRLPWGADKGYDAAESAAELRQARGAGPRLSLGNRGNRPSTDERSGMKALPCPSNTASVSTKGLRLGQTHRGHGPDRLPPQRAGAVAPHLDHGGQRPCQTTQVVGSARENHSQGLDNELGLNNGHVIEYAMQHWDFLATGCRIVYSFGRNPATPVLA